MRARAYLTDMMSGGGGGGGGQVRRGGGRGRDLTDMMRPAVVMMPPVRSTARHTDARSDLVPPPPHPSHP